MFVVLSPSQFVHGRQHSLHHW